MTAIIMHFNNDEHEMFNLASTLAWQQQLPTSVFVWYWRIAPRIQYRKQLHLEQHTFVAFWALYILGREQFYSNLKAPRYTPENELY
jgi:hypothetical protein